MEDTATIDTGTVDTQSAEPDSTQAEAPVKETDTQAATPASIPSLKSLLKREKDDPNVQFTDAELDVLDKHFEKIDSKPKGKAKAQAEPADDETEDNPISEPKDQPEKKEEQPDEEEDADEADDPEAKAILKEVGAKSLKDAAAKIKDLKRLVGGKDAQAVARVTKERDDLARSGRELWNALARGDAQAMAFAEKTFGVKFGSQQQPAAKQDSTTISEGEHYVNPDQFIDPESANLVNAAFKRQADMIKALEGRFGSIEQERDRHIQETINKQSIATVVDEMADIAQYLPDLKGMNGFREAAQAVLNGKTDARLDVFTELFDIAAEIPGATLKHAFDIKRGRDSHRIEAVAKEQGRKEAYNQKPNPSLSGHTGGRGEASYTNLTEADIEGLENGTKPIPDSWFDKDENLIQSKVPKRAWKAFGFR